MAKRGRPRKYSAGPDYGPVYRQLQFARRLGWPYQIDGERVRMTPPEGRHEKDAAKYCETWLATLYGRGLIDRDQFEAGTRLQNDCWRSFGRPHSAAFDPSDPAHSDFEGDVQQAQKRALAMKAILRGRSSSIHDAVVNLVQYDRQPPLNPRTGMYRQMVKILDGLDAIADSFVRSKKVA